MSSTSYTVDYMYNDSLKSVNEKADINGVITLSGLKSGTYSNLEVGQGSCKSTPLLSFTLTDPNPPATPTIMANGPLCSGDTLNLSAGSSSAGVSYSWTGPNGYSSNQQNPSILNIGTSGSGNYTVRTSLNNCTSSASITVNVNPTPDVSPTPLIQTICSNSTTEIILTGTITGTVFNWTTNTNQNIAGNSAGTGTSILQNLINSSLIAQSVKYSITPNYTAYGLTCQGTAVQVSIIVNPVPDVVTSSTNDTICSNTTTNINLSSSVNNVTFDWTVNGNPNITGYSSGTGSNIKQNLVNNSPILQTIIYTITPYYSNNGIMCQGVSIFDTVVVNPVPIINFSKGNQTICSGTQSDQVLLSSTTPGVSFSWQSIPPSGITGTVNSGTNNIPVQTIINSTISPININFKAFASTEGSGCTGTEYSYTITINPIPGGQATPTSQIICSNSSCNILLSSNVTGTLFDWVVSKNPYIEGNIDGSDSLISQNLIDESAVPQQVIYTIIPTYTNNTVTCTGLSFNDTITINPTPELLNSLVQNGICTNTVFNFKPTSATPNTTFIWSRNVISGITNASVSNRLDSINETLINTTSTPIPVLYSYVLNANGCSNTGNITDTVYPNAKSSFLADTLISCTPYILSNHLQVIRYPDANDESQYIWIANNNPIATGLQVPSYSISQPSDTVTIKLVAISKWGCLNDTSNATIYTIQNPVPSFTKSADTACGPVDIEFINTTYPINVINNSQYNWDFGNGVTSNLVHPGFVTYQPSALYKDTTYYISLTVITNCESVVYLDSILIKSGAKSLFTPVATVGCSPFKVNFTNNSLGADKQGNGMTYYWNFGDSYSDTTYNLSAVTHIYHNGSQKIDTFPVTLISKNSCGVDSLSYIELVYPNSVVPAIIVNGNEKYGCAPHTVHFYNNSTGATSFYWSFQDGTTLSTTKTSDTVLHVFYNPGTYIVTMDASNGCSDTTVSDTVVVYPSLPSPSFSIANSSICLSDSIQFVNSSDTSLINSFSWNLGDGFTSTSFELNHQFADAGIYQVTLTGSRLYTSGVACSSSITKSVQVFSNPIAVFTSNANILNCSPFNYVVNTTPALAESAEWFFEDPYSTDTTAVGFTASHVFLKGGTYKVILRATNQNGCTDSTLQFVAITESPIANFTFTDSVICSRGVTSKTITFTNVSTYSGSNLVTYQWLVNGNVISTSTNYSNLTYTFSYAASDVLPKIFTVTLIATSSIGCSTVHSDTIFFVPYPNAAFILSNNQACSNSLITAMDTLTSVFHQRLWTWSTLNPNELPLVLNSDTSNIIGIQTPLNTTTQPINYNLKLWVNSGNLCADSVTQVITVYPNPVIGFNINDSICPNTNYTLQNISEPNNGEPANNMQFQWYIRKFNSFGDTVLVNYFNNYSPVLNISNSSISDNIYFIKLAGSTNQGCIDSSVKEIVVHPATVASFTSTPSISCTPMSLYVLTNSSLNAGSYRWFINNQFYSNAVVPTDTILNVSGINYYLKLVANNNYGCSSDSAITTIIAYPSPISKFTMSQDSSCNGNLLVHFFNHSSAVGTSLISWLWDFGDGTTSSLQNPDHIYTIPGVYQVVLTVQDGRGCYSDGSIQQTVKVYGPAAANFYAYNVCLGDSIHLINVSTPGYGSNNFSLVSWDFGDGSTSQLFSPNHLYNAPGNYTISLVVLGNNSCITDTISKTITVYGKPKANFTWDISCVKLPITFTNLSTTGFGISAFSSVYWNFGNGEVSNELNPTVSYSNTDIFTVSLQVNDAICNNLSDTIYKNIEIKAPRDGQIYPRLDAAYGYPLALNALSGGVTYNWTPSTGLNLTDIQNPLALYNIADPNDINYNILIIDSAGCRITDYQEVFIFMKPSILAPSTLIPNGNDPLNRRFLPHYININRLVYLRILDRWGVEQFTTSDMNKYWDGNNKSGNPLPMATYIWIAVGIDDNGNQVIGKGDVTLIRN